MRETKKKYQFSSGKFRIKGGGILEGSLYLFLSFQDLFVSPDLLVNLQHNLLEADIWDNPPSSTLLEITLIQSALQHTVRSYLNPIHPVAMLEILLIQSILLHC